MLGAGTHELEGRTAVNPAVFLPESPQSGNISEEAQPVLGRRRNRGPRGGDDCSVKRLKPLYSLALLLVLF